MLSCVKLRKKRLMQTEFSLNLRSLCADRGSIAQVCREIGINRQQFNRYLGGHSLPSAHNMRRIARYFGVGEGDLLSPDMARSPDRLALAKGLGRSPLAVFGNAFSDQAKNLRRYLGFYHAHFKTPSWPGQIMRSLMWLRERDGFVVTRASERVDSLADGIHTRIRYDGLITYRGSRIYVIEHERGAGNSIVETILFPAHRLQAGYLRGMSLGVAWRPRLTPYSSRTIWKKLHERTSLREAIEACGVFSQDGRQLDPTVRQFLNKEGGADDDGSAMQDFF